MKYLKPTILQKVLGLRGISALLREGEIMGLTQVGVSFICLSERKKKKTNNFLGHIHLKSFSKKIVKLGQST